MVTPPFDHDEMLERASETFAFDTEQRQMCVDDMEFTFIAGNQWNDDLKAKRPNKPCYEFNQLRQLVRAITGQQLKNKPDIKVRAVEDGDVELAKIYNGLIRNIEVNSNASTAYDTAFQWAVGGGYGVLRVVSEYESDSTFDQCLKVRCVQDPMTVWCDPSAVEFDRSDARFWFITDMIPRSEFKRRWPKADIVDFDSPTQIGAQERGWWREKEVRIAEYWYKVPKKKTLYLLTSGATVWADEFDPLAEQAAEAGIEIQSEREVDTDEIWSCTVSGKGALEKPQKWGGSMFPIVPQWGDIVAVGGKQHYSGMTRFSKDAQTIKNFELSTMVEVVSKLPNSPLMATATQIQGLESYYERMGYDDPPVMLYNVDPMAPTSRPTREPMPTLPTALASIGQMMTSELKTTSGVFDASVGAMSNETSGKAILARQNQGDITNFCYTDNQVKALTRLGQVLVDAIPHYYDGQRSVRILGEDMAESFVEVNKPLPDGQVINDLSKAKYDVTVTVGKNFDTARMELAEAAQALAQMPGPFGMLGQYLLIKNLDVPGTAEVVDAARKLMVQQGILPPGPNDQPPAPPPPHPMELAETEEMLAKSKQRLASAKLDVAKAEKEQVETDMQVMALQVNGIAPPPGYIPGPNPLPDAQSSGPPSGGPPPEQMPPPPGGGLPVQ